MQYCMNRHKLDRRIYAYLAQAYLSEHCVKPIHHFSVRKREAREFYGSGLVSNQVLTIVTTRREK